MLRIDSMVGTKLLEPSANELDIVDNSKVVAE